MSEHYEYDTAKPVYVEWIDACGNNGWEWPSCVDTEGVKCKSLGWLVAESDDAIAVACSFAESGKADVGNSSRFSRLHDVPGVPAQVR